MEHSKVSAQSSLSKTEFIHLIFALAIFFITFSKNIYAEIPSKIYGPNGSYIYAMTIDPTEMALYFGISNKGVYKYPTHGESSNKFIPINSGLSDKHVSSLIIFDGYLYAGNGTGIYKYPLEAGTNGKWNRTSFGPMPHEIYTLHLANKVLYAATYKNVYKCDLENGDTCKWQIIGKPMPSQQIVGLLSVGDLLFAATARGVFQHPMSGEADAKWVRTGSGLNTMVLNLAVYDNRLFAITDKGIFHYFLSDNLETSWIYDGLSEKIITAIFTSGDILYVGTYEEGIFTCPVYECAEDNWSKVDQDLQGATVHTFTQIGATLFATSDNGIYTIPITKVGPPQIADSKEHTNTQAPQKTPIIFWLFGIFYLIWAPFATWGCLSLFKYVSMKKIRQASKSGDWTELARISYPWRSCMNILSIILIFALTYISHQYSVVLSYKLRVLYAFIVVELIHIVSKHYITSYLMLTIHDMNVWRRDKVDIKKPPSFFDISEITFQVIAVLFFILILLTKLPNFKTLTVIWSVAVFVAIPFWSNGGLAFFGHRLKLFLPPSNRLTSIMEEAINRTKVRPRAYFEINTIQANALAFPWARTILFTRPALQALSDDELVDIAMHELSHLNEPRRMLFYRALPLTCALMILILWICRQTIPNLFVFYSCFYATLIVSIISSTKNRKWSKIMEHRADILAADSGKNSKTFAAALEKLYRLNLAPPVGATRKGHANLYDRLISLGAQPDFQRPPKPSWTSSIFTMLLAVFFTILTSLLPVVLLFYYFMQKAA